MKIAVTGSSGFVGSALIPQLEARGHEVLRLVRGRGGGGDPKAIDWDPLKATIDAPKLEGVDAVVHLAGENIAAGRWTSAFKERLRSSRVESTRLLVETLSKLARKPSVLVSASAVGFYGDRGEEVLDEGATAGRGFLADVCGAWEAEARAAGRAGIRVVLLRIGVVLGQGGGALQKMLLPFKLGMGGKIGSGRQHWSWITLDDLLRAILHALETPTLQGPVNAVSPNPVTNAEFTRALGKALSRPTLIPMPAFAARAAFGEMADELFLASARVVPRALERAGFRFEHPTIEGALRKILGGR